MPAIHINKQEQRHCFEASPGEKLLFAGLRAGIPLPYECATGTCGSCRGKLKSGRLDHGWLHAPGRKNFKAGRQEVLMCQAVALSPCHLAVTADIKPFRDDDLPPKHYHGAISSSALLTADVLHFTVKLSAPAHFHAGQFFVLRAPGVNGYRAYSMVNYSTPTDSLEFIIKRKPGGEFSDWMFESDSINLPLELFGPLGRATFHEDESCDLFLIAGGSGIAGLLSILEHVCATDYLRSHKVTLFFGVRTWSDLFFSERLISMHKRGAGNLEIHIVASEERTGEKPPAWLSVFSVAHGWVHQEAIKAVPPGAANTLVYVAGPQPMVDASIQSLIVEAKIQPLMIRYDKFT